MSAPAEKEKNSDELLTQWEKELKMLEQEHKRKKTT
jgi:hypothetical protein